MSVHTPIARYLDVAHVFCYADVMLYAMTSAWPLHAHMLYVLSLGSFLRLIHWVSHKPGRFSSASSFDVYQGLRHAVQSILSCGSPVNSNFFASCVVSASA
jgi:hypothetical protein